MSESAQVQEGTHKVRVRNWGIRETAKGGHQAYVGFSNGLTFYSPVRESQDDNSILLNSLKVCGLKDENLYNLADAEHGLNKEKEVEIFVKYKPDADGKPRPNVYVNDPSKSMKGALSKDEMVMALKKLGFKKKSSAPVETQADEDEIDIPF